MRIASSAVLAALLAVLTTNASALGDEDREPLIAPDTAPHYRLSGIRVDKDHFGRAELVIDYTRQRDGDGEVRIAGNTPDGPLVITGSLPEFDRESGQIRLSKLFGAGAGSYDYEVYLVTPANWAGEELGDCMVSNTVRLGKPGQKTVAREWTDSERAAYRRHLRGKNPPAELPEGFVRATSKTELLPGMPIKVGHYGEWQDAEVVENINHILISVLVDGEARLKRKPKTGWIAVNREVLKQGEKNPSQFSTDIRILTGGTLPLPEDAVQLPDDIDLIVGTPLLVDRGGQWSEAYVVDADAGTVQVRFGGTVTTVDRDRPRERYAIRLSTLDELSGSATAEHFAADLLAPRQGPAGDPGEKDEALDSSMVFPLGDVQQVAWDRAKRREHYAISIELPAASQVIPKDLKLDPETPVAFCWQEEWQPATVLSENTDGSVNIHWTGHADAFDCSVIRSELIIQDKSVSLLRKKYGKSAAEFPTAMRPMDLTKALRTWTDATGEYKIEARLVSQTAQSVTIRTKAGREIIVAMNKLSQDDRRFLQQVKPKAENPFAP